MITKVYEFLGHQRGPGRDTSRDTRGPAEEEQEDTGPAQGPGAGGNSRTASHARTTRTRNTTSRLGGSIRGLAPPTSDMFQNF